MSWAHRASVQKMRASLACRQIFLVPVHRAAPLPGLLWGMGSRALLAPARKTRALALSPVRRATRLPRSPLGTGCMRQGWPAETRPARRRSTAAEGVVNLRSAIRSAVAFAPHHRRASQRITARRAPCQVAMMGRRRKRLRTWSYRHRTWPRAAPNPPSQLRNRGARRRRRCRRWVGRQLQCAEPRQKVCGVITRALEGAASSLRRPQSKIRCWQLMWGNGSDRAPQDSRLRC